MTVSNGRAIGMPERTADQMASELAQMDRKSLIEILQDMKCTFELDFTDEFLNSVSIERLRHIALGASLHINQES